jgi:hypothetical protein
MNPPHNPVAIETLLATNLAKIEHSLARIAHALEALVEQSDPNFKSLDERLAEQRRPR